VEAIMNHKNFKLGRKAQTGFTLLEATIAILVLSFGILSLAAIFTQGLAIAGGTQFDYIAQKKAEEAVESIFSARNTSEYSWPRIQNVSAGGIFIDEADPLYAPGPDGLVGTALEDKTRPDVVVIDPGPDGIMGTSDDVSVPLSGMTRQIQIGNVLDAAGNIQPNVRQITVIMRYQVGAVQRTYTLVSYISAFA
jgi:hypothetical protein